MVIGFMLALALQAEEPAPYDDPYLIVRERIEPFQVPGRSYRVFYRNVEQYGPGAPEGRFGWFRYDLRWEWSYYSRGSQCTTESETVILDFVYELPEWTRYDRVRPREREVFDQMYTEQRTFLEGYADLVRRGGYGMLMDLRNIDEKSCEALEESLQAVGEAWADAISEAVGRYEEHAGTVSLADTVCMRTGSRIYRCRD